MGDVVSNIELFFEEYKQKGDIPKELYELMLFTTYNKVIRYLKCKNRFTKITDRGNGKYVLSYNDKNYYFELFADKDIQKADKEILSKSARDKWSLSRSLKLACSMDLIEPKIIMGTSNCSLMSFLISFKDKEDASTKVIDYANNLIMNMKDYYELFKFNEISTVDKYDIYCINLIIKETGDYACKNIFEYLIFNKEIFNELSKKTVFNFLSKKYDQNGINLKNYLLFGNESDIIFFQDIDNGYTKLQRELDNFTENPKVLSKHISYDEKKREYVLKASKNSKFYFNLLSDFVDNEGTKSELLSKKRYHHCHVNSQVVANGLGDNSLIVGGKVKINENDYFYHSWVEEENLVYDYNHNIIMDKEEYYKLYGAIPISKTNNHNMKDIIKKLVLDCNIVDSMTINYLGEEFYKDFLRNEKVLKKKL